MNYRYTLWNQISVSKDDIHDNLIGHNNVQCAMCNIWYDDHNVPDGWKVYLAIFDQNVPRMERSE